MPLAFPRLRAAALISALAAGAAWAGGFWWFLLAIDAPTPPPPRADGIVALTGGADRVEAALRLLDAGLAPRLLISGVRPGVTLDALLRRQNAETGEPSRITLGRRARSTHGNGREAADWAEASGAASLIVVTAFYHMPRALLELRRAAPGLRLFPAPVRPAMRRDGDPAAPPGLMGEYTKLLLAWAGFGGASEFKR